MIFLSFPDRNTAQDRESIVVAPVDDTQAVEFMKGGRQLSTIGSASRNPYSTNLSKFNWLVRHCIEAGWDLCIWENGAIPKASSTLTLAGLISEATGRFHLIFGKRERVVPHLHLDFRSGIESRRDAKILYFEKYREIYPSIFGAVSYKNLEYWGFSKFHIPRWADPRAVLSFPLSVGLMNRYFRQLFCSIMEHHMSTVTRAYADTA